MWDLSRVAATPDNSPSRYRTQEVSGATAEATRQALFSRLAHVVGAPPADGYPVENQVVELCLIGRYYGEERIDPAGSTGVSATHAQGGSMMARMRILIKEAGVELTAVLNDSATAAALWRVLPLESSAQTWGDEVYFSVPLECRAEDPQATVASGTVGYWPPGKAVCLFFGQQPVSPVNVIGVLAGDANLLEAVRDGQLVRLERLAV
jgi:hypothetical protein